MWVTTGTIRQVIWKLPPVSLHDKQQSLQTHAVPSQTLLTPIEFYYNGLYKYIPTFSKTAIGHVDRLGGSV